MNLLRKPLLFALAGLAAFSLVAVACGDDDDDDDTGGDATSTAAATTDGGSGDAVVVKIQDNAFPAKTEVSAGGTVSWDWSGAANPHSVVWTSDNADFDDSPTNTGSGDYEVTFDEAGTYEYQCGVHGAAMTGSIVVS